MAITAKRFTFLDKETNVAITEFKGINSSKILNSVNNELKTISKDLDGFISNASQALKNSDAGKLFDGIKKEVDGILKSDLVTNAKELVRETKELVKGVQDIANKLPKEIDKLVAEFIPNDLTAQTLVNKLSAVAKSDLLSDTNIGKAYRDTIQIGNEITKFAGDIKDGKVFTDIVNKVTDGNFKAIVKEVNADINKITSLATYGLKNGLSTTFDALTANITDKNFVSRAKASVAQNLIDSNNTSALINLKPGEDGSTACRYIPDLVPNALGNFTKPNDIFDSQYSMLYDNTKSTMLALDDRCFSSSYDNTLSIANIPMTEKAKEELLPVLEAKRANYAIDQDHFMLAKFSDDEFLCTAPAVDFYNTYSDNIDNNSSSFKDPRTGERIFEDVEAADNTGLINRAAFNIKGNPKDNFANLIDPTGIIQ